jgi:hypothetical protein
MFSLHKTFSRVAVSSSFEAAHLISKLNFENRISFTFVLSSPNYLKIKQWSVPRDYYCVQIYDWQYCRVFHGTYVLSHPPLTQFREIGSIYPTNVYDGNRLLLPVLRQKMVLSDEWCLFTCQMVVVMGIEIPEIQFQYQDRIITLSIQIIEHWIIEQMQTERNRTESNESRTILMNNNGNW